MFGSVGMGTAVAQAIWLDMCRKWFMRSGLLAVVVLVILIGDAILTTDAAPTLVADPQYPADVGALCRLEDAGHASGWSCVNGHWQPDMKVTPRNQPVPDDMRKVFRENLSQE